MAYLELKNIGIQLGSFTLRDINFRVEKTRHHLLIGECGSGKTTLLEIIAGFKNPSAGKVILSGKDITGYPPQTRRFAFLCQEDSLFPHLSVRQNICYGLRFRKISRIEKERRLKGISSILKLDDFIDRKNCATLSGGQKKLVAVARALVIEPDLLLLDEPTGFLDSETKRNLIDILVRIQQNVNLTILQVSHDWHDIADIADNITEIKNGQLMVRKRV